MTYPSYPNHAAAHTPNTPHPPHSPHPMDTGDTGRMRDQGFRQDLKVRVQRRLMETLDLVAAQKLPVHELRDECLRRVDLLLNEQRTPLIPARPPTVRPLAPERHEFRFTASAEARANLREVPDLLRHTIPSGDPAQIIERALKLLVEQLRRKKYAVTDRPRAGGVANIRLLCRAHNAFESERFYGHGRPVKNPTLPGASCPPRRSATARDADPPSQIRAGGP